MSHLRGFRQHLRRFEVRIGILLVFLCLFSTAAMQAQGSWTIVGPDGGDARAFAAVPGQPGHLLLGTTNSWLYESLDEGASWHRLAKVDSADGFVLDSIVVDSSQPSTVFVGAWKNSDDGGVWMSHDSGRTWNEPADLKGQSIHALVQAPSDPHVLFAGTLRGVYRSTDSGATWSQISPPDSKEIHEVESLAVDPANPEIVYAGTWHLPWKTTDGGKSWHSIKNGLIVDSDVFSIVIDPEHTHTVYLSACSGIYKSENGGALFRKIQGIPNEARRTRVLMQDPENLEVVYAGTTEGLYKTENGGKTFKRMTGADVVVNDVYVDPKDSNHVLLATDRSGVLASLDAGVTFTASNRGISERKIAALLVDGNDPQRLYAGVVNDKNYGGVFRSTDGGAHWEQLDAGLDGRDVFALDQTKDGTVVAGTSHGVFVLGAQAPGDPAPTQPDAAPSAAAGASTGSAGSTLTWQARNTIANTVEKTVTETHYRTKVNIEKQVKAPVIELESSVNALDVSGDVWVGATSYGLLTSRDQGATWQGGPVMGGREYLSVTVHSDDMAAARDDSVVISTDAGQSWWPLGLPSTLAHIHSVVFAPDGALWLGARDGVYFTRDLGKNWMWLERLPFRDVDDLSYDASVKRILASSRSSDEVYAIDPKALTWDFWQVGYSIVLIRGAGDRLVAASLNDGVLAGPKVPSAAAPAPADASTH